MNSDEFILEGPRYEKEIPNIPLGKYMIERLSHHGNRTAQVDAVTGKSTTFQEILQKSINLADTLRSWGVQKGDTVGILSPNCLEFCLPVLASAYIGAKCAPLNPTYTPRELFHAMMISKPTILFCTPLVKPKLNQLLSVMSFIKKVVIFGEESGENFLAFSACITNKPHKFEPQDVDPNKHIAAILCSSGTTGLPKGVMIDDQSIVSTIELMNDEEGGQMDSDDVHLALLPMFHAYAFFIQFCTLGIGIKSVVMPRFEEKLFLESIQNHKITLMMLVPPLMLFLAKHPLVSQYDLSSVKEIWCGAAPLSAEIQSQVAARLGVKSIRQGYGMTEMTLASLVTPADETRIGSSGKLVRNIQCKVVDLVTGRPLGPGKEGELCFRGPTIMKGYYGDPKSTAETIDKDGFLHSGDIGYYDEDGFFYIIDRLKELIKYKGYQVPPAELEAVLLTHHAIKDAAVIGVPDPEAGELPRAYVVKQAGKSVSEDEIIKFVAAQVSPPKRLHGGVNFVQEIPKNASGKILRRVLRERAKSKL